MYCTFKTKELRLLYEKGESRKYRLPKGVPKKFVERVERIKAADTINDLRTPPSMQFEAMEGYENRFSIRLNREYRLEFEIIFEDEARSRGSVVIAHVSKHYE